LAQVKDPLYRVRQFFHAANAAPLTEDEIERVRPVLNEQALALYQSMPLGDQRHSLVIYDALCARGCTARPLLQAALLHDVAKQRVGLGYRTCVILLNKISPGALCRAASADQKSWRYPFYLSLHHPELGAEWARASGADPEAVELIRTHQDSRPVFRGANAAQLSAWHDALKSLDDKN
jgi:hypothetical protein